jgi:cob(I)alamin adenosyltransferase
MSKFYTSSGDQGITGTLGKQRIPKNDPRIRAVGAVDEASESLGFARALSKNSELNEIVKEIQLDLYQIMSQLVLEKSDPEKYPDLENSRLDWLEKIISNFENEISIPEGFIVPGDSLPSAAFGLARTIVRRAEREVVQLMNADLLFSAVALPYLNRLSSLCYVLELLTSEYPPTQTG